MIAINGYESYQAWVDAGCPGAVSFDAQGNRKGVFSYAVAKPAPRTRACIECGKAVKIGPRCRNCGQRDSWRPKGKRWPVRP